MDTIRRQYYCEFIQGTNQFFDPDDVDGIFTDALEKTKDYDKPVDVGVDFGGSSSSHTVVTVSHFDEERGRIERIWHKRYGVQEDLNLVKDIATLRKIFDVQRIILEQCLDENTNVLMADNTRKRIADIEAGEYVKSYDFENEEYVNKKVEKVIDNGYQPTEKITFKNGGSVYATGGHRWFTRSKQNKDNIKVQTTNDLDLTNRYIPQLNGMEKSGKTPISEAEAWLMGMYVAEGHSRSKDNAFFVPQFNEDVWVKLRDKLVKAGWTWQYNNDGMYISDAKDVSSQKYAFEKNDILFGKLRPYFRKVALAKFDGICSTDINVIKPTEIVGRDFLFYTLFRQDFIDVADKTSTGTRMPRADWSKLTDMKVALPPLEEQKKISSIM
jgi:hypothetical protein